VTETIELTVLARLFQKGDIIRMDPDRLVYKVVVEVRKSSITVRDVEWSDYPPFWLRNILQLLRGAR
jgi:hypothetical protein